MELSVPSQVAEIIGILKEHTYEAYLVGDCVRLLLKGENCLDFDIITDAEMGRLLAIFEDRFKTNTDYVNKGELIIINGAMGISVSPYRSRMAEDGRPVYCHTPEEDLKRRAFRANAVAYNLTDGIFDPFGGYEELMGENVVLSAIVTDEPAQKKAVKGKPEPVSTTFSVFENSPEAMLEAIRRYSTEGVEVSEETLANICENPEIIFRVSREEFQRNFRSIMLGKRVTDTLMQFKEIFFALIPKLRETDGYDQRSIVQEYPLYEHIARSVGYAVPDFTIRTALLFHGIGKPDCAADMGTHISYSGHAVRGSMLTREIMTELEFPAELTRQVSFLVYHHDDDINESNYTSYTAEYGTDNARMMVLMKAADIRAKRSDYDYEQRAGELRFVADEIGRIGNEYTRKNSVTLADLKKLTESLGL
ncbi:MAG: hypothetical protein IJ416_05685 [Ruminiclostridium sp.]|nr:hypothetical protein [Ruminiclostridium sp.]